MGGNYGVFVAVAVDVGCCLVAPEEAELICCFSQEKQSFQIISPPRRTSLEVESIFKNFHC